MMTPEARDFSLRIAQTKKSAETQKKERVVASKKWSKRLLVRHDALLRRRSSTRTALKRGAHCGRCAAWKTGCCAAGSSWRIARRAKTAPEFSDRQLVVFGDSSTRIF